MAKASIYMASRTVKRLSKDAVKNAIGHFVSTGMFDGPSDIAAEVANYALEHGWSVNINVPTEGCATLRRVL